MEKNNVAEIQPEQALMNLDNAIAQINATREVHVALQNSVNLLRTVVNEWRAFTMDKVKENQTGEK